MTIDVFKLLKIVADRKTTSQKRVPQVKSARGETIMTTLLNQTCLNFPVFITFYNEEKMKLDFCIFINDILQEQILCQYVDFKNGLSPECVNNLRRNVAGCGLHERKFCLNKEKMNYFIEV